MWKKAAGFVCLTIALHASAIAQDDLRTNKELADQIRELAAQGPETKAEQTKLIWVLVMRSMHGDKSAHQAGRNAAERLTGADDLNYRAKFAYGFFRLLEAYDSRDPVLRKRRIDEGRRLMTTALPVGARDADFQFDAGMALVGLETNVALFAEGLNALTLARRTFADGWVNVSKDRQADWHVSMAAGFLHIGLTELARDQYKMAYETSPESASGRKAAVWIRTHGG